MARWRREDIAWGFKAGASVKPSSSTATGPGGVGVWVEDDGEWGAVELEGRCGGGGGDDDGEEEDAPKFSRGKRKK